MSANHLFWKFIFYLIINEHLRMIDISPDKKQVWIEKEDKAIIRIVKVEHDWMKDLEADKATAKRMFKKIKTLIPSRRLDFYNVYVSTYPPVDLSSRLNEYWVNEENMQSFFMASESAQWTVDEPGDVLKVMGFESVWEDIPERTAQEHQQYARAYSREVSRKQEQLERQDKNLLLFGKTRFTYILLTAILLMFFLIEQAGSSTDILTLIEFGAKYNPAILEGEWWRLFSAMFLHIGFFHLFMNSLALFYLGTAVERIYGTFRFIFIYFTAGLFGSLASFAFNEQISAGASGAIFGCFGALLYFGFIHRKLFFRSMGMNVILILAVNLAFGFMVPAVDNGAHIGGLIGGFLASGVLHLPKHGVHLRQALIFTVSLALGAGLFWYGHANEGKAESPLVDLQVAQELIEQEELAAAESILESLLNDHDNAHAYFLLGSIAIKEEDYHSAGMHLEKAASMEDDFIEAHYNLALVYVELQEFDKAELSLERARSIDGASSDDRLDFDHVQELINEAGQNESS
ncbi:rhomboid protease GluP [Alteribacillus persepolensis]|uniref:Rhomboid protease GluP n=1 Tax=Alteribacillus persepolensis TaxID=568899 RepID=A0A1G8CX64_9BACI|nr:rhomboid family intramembrane serine protease [Alteribacillus persepolensis]SDH49570.1 rhomboid protease GluP [Alteribacillus persepolensis]